ncbi:MAG TPA: hypothetical protein VNQ78_18765 [Paracoccus sp. (in: a-proteobacteria)]|uniref:hypothetical protein n=1 Tax=Paracoccus sp. TaxID=267 RepID=UPI002BA7A045|nr:hypothetical protein [Paracoccus sp. (in: a-proteobacteria)]HWL58700.1 hypothetical protein [Paracoccus sp. (in: a-proteobacteria)]
MSIKHDTRVLRTMDAHIAERRELAPIPSPIEPDHLRDVGYELGQIAYTAMLDAVKRFSEYFDCRGDSYSEPDHLYQNINRMVNGALMTNKTKHRTATNRRDLSLPDQHLFAVICYAVADVMDEGMRLLLPCEMIMNGVRHTVADYSRVSLPHRQRLTWSVLQ